MFAVHDVYLYMGSWYIRITHLIPFISPSLPLTRFPPSPDSLPFAKDLSLFYLLLSQDFVKLPRQALNLGTSCFSFPSS